MAISDNWTRENIAWAAGLFEGEGCVGVYSKPSGSRGPRKGPTMKITMTDRDVLDKFHGIVGVGSISGPQRHKGKEHHKEFWSWACNGTEKVQALLAAFWPFLCSRRQAKAADVIREMATIPLRASKSRQFCKKGHAYTEATTYEYDGKRRCATCDIERGTRWYYNNLERSRALARARYWKKKEAAHGH